MKDFRNKRVRRDSPQCPHVAPSKVKGKSQEIEGNVSDIKRCKSIVTPSPFQIPTSNRFDGLECEHHLSDTEHVPVENGKVEYSKHRKLSRVPGKKGKKVACPQKNGQNSPF